MKVMIDIFDKDYNAYIGSETIDVNSLYDANKYCKENNWSGEHYIVDKIIEE